MTAYEFANETADFLNHSLFTNDAKVIELSPIEYKVSFTKTRQQTIEFEITIKETEHGFSFIYENTYKNSKRTKHNLVPLEVFDEISLNLLNITLRRCVNDFERVQTDL